MRFRLVVSAMAGLVAVVLMAAPSAAATTAPNVGPTCSSDVKPIFHVIHLGTAVVVGNLRGNVHEGDTVTVTFTGPADAGVPCTWSLSSYQAVSSKFVVSEMTRQVRSAFTSASGGGVPQTLTVVVPDCFFQVDFANGPSIPKLSPTVRYGPRLISADNGGTKSCVTVPPVTVTPVTPDCSLVAVTGISSAFIFTNPTTSSISVAVTRTVVGPPQKTDPLPALTVPPGTTTFTLPAVEDATQDFNFVGSGVNVTTPPVTIDCLKPQASIVPTCNTVSGMITATLSMVNPDAAAEPVQVSTTIGAGVPVVVSLMTGANGVPAILLTSAPFFPAAPPTYVVTDASETPVFSQTLTVTGFKCVGTT